MLTDVIEARGRLGTRLAQQYDADGKEIKFEVREDEEQNVKLQETIELLVAAGYFRARIKGLPVFDKVMGGIVWCISVCDIDVDVDLLYEENSTIGQKIKLTEKIVKVLSTMKCPFAIEPHQIQGLDFIHIFPVVQWLVKRAIMVREEVGDAVQRYADFQYSQHYGQTTADAQKGEVAKMDEMMRSLATPPKRLYKRVDPSPLTEESKRVQSTLLEYGLGISSNLVRQVTHDIGEQREKEDKEPVDSLMAGMADVSDTLPGVSAAAISSAIGESGIREMSAKLASEFGDIRAEYRLGAGPGKEATIDSLESRKEELQTDLSKISTEHEDLRRVVVEGQKQRETLQSREKDLDEEIHRLRELSAAADSSAMETMNDLLAQRQAVKKRESEFKTRCKEEVTSLENELTNLRQRESKTDESVETLKQLREKRQKAETTLSEARLDAAGVNRQIAMLQRWIDDVPSNAELNQYQRRFLELYNQIANKHKETKQFYALFNTLQDVKAYMEKEVHLLNSIYDNYQLALQSEDSKLQFLKQLEQSLESIKQGKIRFEKKDLEQQSKRDALRSSHQELLDKQRLYYKTVKEFQAECKKHELGTVLLREAGVME